MTTLQDLEKCSKVRRLPVFGFIREQRKLLSLTMIPTAIKYLCLSFYEPPDFFVKYENNENRVKLSSDQSTATVQYDYGNRVALYGYNWIDSSSKNKHEWTFKINKISERFQQSLHRLQQFTTR